MTVTGGSQGLNIAVLESASELLDFASWSLSIISADNPDARGYWEQLSWEVADKYQPDLLLVDNRYSAMAALQAEPSWPLMLKAAEAGAGYRSA